ncbi:carboxypeptidase M32 [Enterococcus thailandicus]|uniref:carboxypeptidase M32 n=1 Tax=Enterococcus thailandicus TaxID=417368 RepID=UPI0022EBB1C2|nr:carboxypeptidase M32 [Enterococcus thailandicus]MDA3972475.1 carboxypeptidase M32 [Enterococcus thailandicus]MDA3974971.1 carboxypeptidase M32 [Enterococcus thailandicus]MDA3979935.1 carboxypeptidase M32 [Enterococcus thailandicus]
MKETEFLQELKEINLLQQALGILDWDTQTGMPEKASEYRSAVDSYLYSLYFAKKVGPKIEEALAYFGEHPEELSEVGQAAYRKVKEEFELEHNVPQELMTKYSAAISSAHGQWQKSRETKQFADFESALTQNIELTKELIPYWQKDEKTPYDVLLNQYEPGMTVEILDKVFAQLKDGIMSIREEISEKGTEPETSFLSRKMTKEQQKRFVVGVIEQLGYDFSRGRLDDTIHPFMTGINPNDARITTRWNEHDFQMAVFGVIHEAGHGMYEQDIDDKYAYTPVYQGASMGIHESQSLFNEIIVGSNRSFWEKQYPFFQECAEGAFTDIAFADFYRSLKRTRASLIRIEADSLTYPLHIIIRYEIEKMIFNENLAIAELPEVWNQKYEEYLGVRPTNDLEGILQDVHWSGASFGYFPSYALGYMYAAQLLHALEKELSIDEVLASDDYSPIKKWMEKHIHQYGASRKPNQLIQDATNEPLNPNYLIEYMRNLYFDVYQVN